MDGPILDGKNSRYFEVANLRDRPWIFETVVEVESEGSPPAGGVVLESETLRTPDGRLFASISYHLNSSQWASLIEHGCSRAGIVWGKIDRATFVTSDSTITPLGKCRREIVDYSKEEFGAVRPLRPGSWG
jgi:hypothetical protein